MMGKRTLDAWLTSAARSSPVPAAPPAEAKAAALGLRTPLTVSAAEACAKSRLDPLEHHLSRSGADVLRHHQALRACVIACVGWEGAEDEARDLRDEIVSAGGTVVLAERVEPGGCTHILVGPAGGAPDEPLLLQAVAAGARLVDAAWVMQVCLNGAQSPAVAHSPAVAQSPPAGTSITPVGSSGSATGNASSRAGVGDGPADAAGVDPGADDPMDPMDEEEVQPIVPPPGWHPGWESSHGGGDAWSGVPPLPAGYCDAWDREHVRFPCSPRARCADDTPLWPVLYRALQPPPTDLEELLRSLRTIRKAVSGMWGLERIKELVSTVMAPSERGVFFGSIVPELCTLVLQTPELFLSPLPLLRRGASRAVELTADQCGCLLAHGFFCTLPFRNDSPRGGGARANGLPYFSFCWLLGDLPAPRFDRAGCSLSAQHRAKWLCLLIYFERIAGRRRGADAAEWGGRRVSFSRLVADTSELELDGSWLGCGAPVCAVTASGAGTIEDAGPAALQVDFANATIGGGVLRHGCVQEEIRFLICPELIVSRVLAETLADNEALAIRGFERFSKYTGYASSFACAGRYEDGARPDGSPRPPSEPLLTSLVAIDATPYGRDMGVRMSQYRHRYMEREMNKAFVGFGPFEAVSAEHAPATLEVCTGNWGCGAFGGCLQLKAVLQILAASRARRPAVRYLTFGDQQLARGINALAARVTAAQLRTGQLVHLLLRFQPDRWPADRPGACANLFGYLAQALDMAQRADRLQRSSLPPSAHAASRPACGGAAAGESGGTEMEKDVPEEFSCDAPPTASGSGLPIAALRSEEVVGRADECSVMPRGGGGWGGGWVAAPAGDGNAEALPDDPIASGAPLTSVQHHHGTWAPFVAVGDSDETEVGIPNEVPAVGPKDGGGPVAERLIAGLVVAPTSSGQQRSVRPEAAATMLDDARDGDGGRAAAHLFEGPGGHMVGQAESSAAQAQRFATCWVGGGDEQERR